MCEQTDLVIDPNDQIIITPESQVVVRYVCGHGFASKYAVSIYGEPRIFDRVFWRELPYCGDCLKELLLKHSIRCGRCRKSIEPGTGVAVYNADAVDPERVPGSLITEYDGHKIILGCLRMDCCPSGACYGGHWYSDRGFVADATFLAL